LLNVKAYDIYSKRAKTKAIKGVRSVYLLSTSILQSNIL
jgi:hypothetical protein